MKKLACWLALEAQDLRASQEGLSNAAIVLLILLVVVILTAIFARPIREYVTSQWK